MLLNNLPALCLDEIFEILYEDGLLKSLSHCAIVNRRWYTLVIPKLWRHPFYPSRAIFKESCINSIIPFLPSLTYRNNKKSIKLSPNHTQSCHNNNSHNHINHQPFYNYLQYLQIFDLERIETDSRYWINENVRFAIESQYEFESEIVDESEVDNEIEEISWKFTKSLYEYFINNSLNIRTVVLGMNNNYTKRQNLLSEEEEEKELNIFLYPNAKTNLSKVKTLITHGEYVSGLLLTASKILRNLKEIQLILTNTNYFATTFEDLGSLIKAQKSLETMLIRCSRSKPLGFKNIFQSLIDTQLESLTSLTLENVDFHDEFPIKLFASLKYLKLERCINFGNNNKIIIINNNIITAHNNNNNNRNIGNCSFSKLTTLIINDCPIPSEFPEIIFSKSSKNLTCLKFMGEKTISNCSNYLTLLSNYCQNLKYFSGTIKLDQQQQMLDLIEFFKSSQNLEKITINHLKKVRTNGRSQNNIWMKKSLISSSAATKVTKTITTGGNNDDNLFNEFLPEIGKSLPSTVKTFKIKGFLSFSPDCLNQFLINCKGKLKYLGFANCEDFSSAHLGIIIDYIKNKKRSCDNCDGGEILKRLNIRNCYLIKFEDLKYARNFIKVINNFL